MFDFKEPRSHSFSPIIQYPISICYVIQKSVAGFAGRSAGLTFPTSCHLYPKIIRPMFNRAVLPNPTILIFYIMWTICHQLPLGGTGRRDGIGLILSPVNLTPNSNEYMSSRSTSSFPKSFRGRSPKLLSARLRGLQDTNGCH